MLKRNEIFIFKGINIRYMGLFSVNKLHDFDCGIFSSLLRMLLGPHFVLMKGEKIYGKQL